MRLSFSGIASRTGVATGPMLAAALGAALTAAAGCTSTSDPDDLDPAVPRLSLSATSLSFQGTAGGANPPAQTVTVTNSGAGTLAVPVVSVAYGSGAAWLTATVSGTSPPYTITVQPSIGALVGDYSATISVASAGASNSPQSISVTCSVIPAERVGCAWAAGGHAVCGGQLSEGGSALVSAPGGLQVARGVLDSGSATGAPASASFRVEGGFVSAGAVRY